MFKLFGNVGNKEKESGSSFVTAAEKKTDFDKHPLEYALSSVYRVVNELADDVFLRWSPPRSFLSLFLYGFP